MKYIGVYSYAELIANGLTRKTVDRQVRSGELTRLRHDRYADRHADKSVCEVVRKGYAVSCLKALELHGVWVPPTAGETHSSRAGTKASRNRQGVCRPYGPQPRVTTAVDDLAVAFGCAVRCLDGENLLAVMDSILNQKLMTIEEMRSVLSSAPGYKQSLLDRADGRAMSGTESMVRDRLRRKRLEVRVQVKIGGIGWVDLLVGDCLIIEVDSERYHRSKAQRELDRRRDRAAIALGYLPLRFSYDEVIGGWEVAMEELVTIVQANRHYWKRYRDKERNPARRRSEQLEFNPDADPDTYYGQLPTADDHIPDDVDFGELEPIDGDAA